MDNASPQPPIRFDYEAFVDELIALVDQARDMEVSERRHDHLAFRKWKHTVEQLIIKASRTHMDVNCKVHERQFRPMRDVSPRDLQERFDRDLRETVMELDAIISWYKKYGEPDLRYGARPPHAPIAASSTVPAAPVEPGWPDHEKLTLHWLFKHMPLSAWLSLGALSIGSYTVGMTVGSWTIVQKWLEPRTTVTVAAPPKAASK